MDSMGVWQLAAGSQVAANMNNSSSSSSSTLWANRHHEQTLPNVYANCYGAKMDLMSQEILFQYPAQLHKYLASNSQLQDGSPQGAATNANYMAITPAVLPVLNTTLLDHDQLTMMNKVGGVLSTTSCSLESLDCLLSATNSNTDASVEDDDDGISLLFSDCRNLFDVGAKAHTTNVNGTVGVSPGDSSDKKDNIDKSTRDKVKDMMGNNHHVQVLHYDNHLRIDQETGSQGSSDHSNIRQTAKRSYSQRDHSNNRGGFHLVDQTGADHSSSIISSDGGGFRLISHDHHREENISKKPRTTSTSSENNNNNNKRPIITSSSNISFQQPSSSASSSVDQQEPDPEAIAQMKEMIYRAAAFRPVNLGMEVVEKPKRKNVKISTDPQTVAARQRRERISERIRVLQRLVPGGSKMDTASMLDEAANYLKFLRSQVKALENLGHNLNYNSFPNTTSTSTSNLAFSSSFPAASNMHNHFSYQNPNPPIHHH